MPEGREPLIRLEPGGQAPILSYNLPEPAIYFGRNFIELEYDGEVFTDAARQRPAEEAREPEPAPPGDDEAIIDQPTDPAPTPPQDEEELIEPIPQPPPEPPSGGTGGGGAVDHPIPVPPDGPPGGGGDFHLHSGGAVADRPGEDATIRPQSARLDASEMSHQELAGEVERAMRAGFADARVFPNARITTGTLRMVDAPGGKLHVVSNLPVSPELAALDVAEVTAMKEAGRELDLYTSMFGTVRHRYIRRAQSVEPAFLLVETYRLASYLGSYGAGRVIQTFSLLPGERTTISVRTFRKTEEERKQASSILDSFTEESATDFEQTIENEHSSKETFEKSFEYHAEAEARASWGWGKARVSGGVKGGTNSAREEFAKNAASATNKHAQKASAKREVEVDTSYETREVEEQEKSTEREIENINLSRTLNFVFRQMNQEFITISSLVDVRVAFFNGFAESRQEVTLPELDSLLETYVVESERDRVRADIRDSLGSILDFEGKVHNDFIEERELDSDNKYLRVRTEKTSTYKDPVTGTEIQVPGIIVSATKNVMRTDGVMVEALLGTGGALDQYAERLQELEVKRREVELAREEALADRLGIANDAIREKDEEQIDLLKRVSPNGSLNPPLEIAIRHREGSTDGSNKE